MQKVMQTINLNPWYKFLWPWLLMLGPVMVILAGVYTSWLAFARQDAMVVDDYYRQGKAINRDLHRDHVATELGLAFHAHYDAAAGKLEGEVLSFGAPIAGKVWLHLAHPTQPEKDVQLQAQVDQRGAFVIALPMLERARWQVLLENERRNWRLTGIWKWPQHRMIDIRADAMPAHPNIHNQEGGS